MIGPFIALFITLPLPNGSIKVICKLIKITREDRTYNRQGHADSIGLKAPYSINPIKSNCLKCDGIIFQKMVS